MTISVKLRRLAGVALAAGALALVAPAAMAQQAPTTPDWEPPAVAKPSPRGQPVRGKAASRAPASTGGGINAPMRKIDRSDIDMSGVGREVRDFGSGVRPMMSNGGMGVGGGF